MREQPGPLWVAGAGDAPGPTQDGTVRGLASGSQGSG